MSPDTRHGLVGCATAAAVLGITLVLVVAWIYDEAAAQRQRARLAGMPTGWMALVRQRATIPRSVVALEPERDLPGNGALAVHDTAMGVWTIFEMDSAFARVSESRATAADSFTMREVALDTALDRWARYARQTYWEGLDLALARSESAAARDLLLLRVPDYRAVRGATAALALRGWVRAEAGNYAAAERDFRAALGLGAMLARAEPTMSGFLAGRAAVHGGAHGLQHLALLTRDEALADLAADAAAWSAPSTASDYDVLPAAPDSAFALAASDSIALGWRAAALAAMIRGAMVRPSARWLGFPRRVQRRLDRVAAASSGEFGRVARLAAGSGRAIDAMGQRARRERFGN